MQADVYENNGHFDDIHQSYYIKRKEFGMKLCFRSLDAP